MLCDNTHRYNIGQKFSTEKIPYQTECKGELSHAPIVTHHTLSLNWVNPHPQVPKSIKPTAPSSPYNYCGNSCCKENSVSASSAQTVMRLEFSSFKLQFSSLFYFHLNACIDDPVQSKQQEYFEWEITQYSSLPPQLGMVYTMYMYVSA